MPPATAIETETTRAFMRRRTEYRQTFMYQFRMLRKRARGLIKAIQSLHWVDRILKALDQIAAWWVSRRG